MNDIITMNMMQSTKYHAHNPAHLVFFKQAVKPESWVLIHLFLLLIDELLKLGRLLQVLHHYKQVRIVFI